jgi:myosin heavy subunit
MKYELINICDDFQVEYDASQFLEKNQDRLSNEVTNVLAGSLLLLVRTLFNTTVTKTGN